MNLSDRYPYVVDSVMLRRGTKNYSSVLSTTPLHHIDTVYPPLLSLTIRSRVGRQTVEEDGLHHVTEVGSQYMDVAVVEELEMVAQVEVDPARQGGGGEVNVHDARRSDRPGVAAVVMVLLLLLVLIALVIVPVSALSLSFTPTAKGGFALALVRHGHVGEHKGPAGGEAVLGDDGPLSDGVGGLGGQGQILGAVLELGRVVGGDD